MSNIMDANVHNFLAFGSSQYADMSKGICQYRKQLAETRSLLFQQQALRTISIPPEHDVEARRDFVLNRVTREFWMNFCVRGQDNAMLRHLHDALRVEFGNDLQFFTRRVILEWLFCRILRRDPFRYRMKCRQK